MHKRFLAIGAALMCAFAVSGPALGLSRLTVHRGQSIPLPFFVTSNRYWLYAGPLPRRRRVFDNYDYVRLVEEPVGNIVPWAPTMASPGSAAPTECLLATPSSLKSVHYARRRTGRQVKPEHGN